MRMKCETYLIKRDGWARVAEFRIDDESYLSPAVLGRNSILERIELRFAPYSLKEFDRERFERLYFEDETFIAATGLSILPPKKIVKSIIELRTKDFTKPLLATGICTPQNLAFLVYLGVDFFDNSTALMAAHRRIYFYEEGFLNFDKMKELPCHCDACWRLEKSSREVTELLKEHNTLKLLEQAALVRELIREENLRNYIEAKAKFSPELTVMLREADKHPEFSEKMQPRFRRSTVLPTTMESFSRFEISYFLKRVAETYNPKTDYLLILPCSAKKPYLLSRTHKAVRNAIGKLSSRVDEIIVSSPLVVPREFELLYPAMNYDTPVTGIWTDDEVDFVAKHLSKLTEGFERVIAHVDGGYKKVVEKACAEVEVVYTAEKGITSRESLRKLRRELEELPKTDKDLYVSIFESMMRYQFGFIPEVEGGADNLKIRGRYPNLEFYRRKERIARIDMIYGMIDIDIPLTDVFIEKRINLVEIGDFEPKGTIFSSGVEWADSRIRPNDIVFFRNDNFTGVGRAFMSGEEMLTEEKGIAVEVRRKKRL
jgi:archaeosine synthase